MKPRKSAFLAGVLSVGFLLPAVVAAQSDDEAIRKGAAHFRIFCVNCHGMKADGNGPLARILKIQPADLTTLKQSLPEGMTVQERVFRAVDGRHKVGEGQQRNMPVFTDNLKFNTVIEIARFVEAIQK